MSASRILVHLISGTKVRRPSLSPEIQAELHPYLAAVLRNHDCPPLRVGGHVDHVHLLFGLSRTWTIARVVEEIKTSSSKWIKTKGPEFASFAWQGGYAAFSVSPSQEEAVIRYIERQAEHHRRTTFREEYAKFLERHGIGFDEQYVWD